MKEGVREKKHAHRESLNDRKFLNYVFHMFIG